MGERGYRRWDLTLRVGERSRWDRVQVVCDAMGFGRAAGRVFGVEEWGV